MKPRHVLLFTLAAGCAHQSWDDPGSRWTTGTTKHFVVHGDGSRRSLVDVLVRLEETHAALSAGFFPDTDIARVEGIVFTDTEEFETLSGNPRIVGMFVPGVGHTGSLMVVRGDAEADYLDRIVAHELAHRFIARAYPRLPVWVNEGLALYLETVDVRDKGVVFGRAPRDELGTVTDGISVSLAQLMEARGDSLHGPDGHRYYASAWAFMYQLLHAGNGMYASRFPAALRALEMSAGSPAAYAQALSAVYPERTIPEMEQAMFRSAAWMQSSGADRVFGKRMPRVSVEPVTAPADPEQIRTLCSQLLHRRRPR